jgi:segregation and condensation protein B
MDAEIADDDWACDELELAYQRALSALETMDSSVQAVEAVAEQMASEMRPAAHAPNRESADGSSGTQPADAATVQVTPRQVIEACLFVGGGGLTARKLSSILKGDYSAEFVEQAIDELNLQYATERRPYEIRLGEGGYSLTLRDDFERIRFKAFGLGPKEVRLSQDALEILALVAYKQPLAEAEIEALGKPDPGAVLRQLLRRDLVAIHRQPEEPKLVRYATTERFLSLFGIGELEELPRPDEIRFK